MKKKYREQPVEEPKKAPVTKPEKKAE